LFGESFRFRVRAEVAPCIGRRLVETSIIMPGKDDAGRAGIHKLGDAVALTQLKDMTRSDHVGVPELAILSPDSHFGGDVEHHLTTFDGSRQAVDIGEITGNALDAQRFEVGIPPALKRTNAIPPLAKALNDGASEKTAAARD
jgi:hypothetical protein